MLICSYCLTEKLRTYTNYDVLLVYVKPTVSFLKYACLCSQLVILYAAAKSLCSKQTKNRDSKIITTSGACTKDFEEILPVCMNSNTSIL